MFYQLVEHCWIMLGSWTREQTSTSSSTPLHGLFAAASSSTVAYITLKAFSHVLPLSLVPPDGEDGESCEVQTAVCSSVSQTACSFWKPSLVQIWKKGDENTQRLKKERKKKEVSFNQTIWNMHTFLVKILFQLQAMSWEINNDRNEQKKK